MFHHEGGHKVFQPPHSAHTWTICSNEMFTDALLKAGVRLERLSLEEDANDHLSNQLDSQQAISADLLRYG